MSKKARVVGGVLTLVAGVAALVAVPPWLQRRERAQALTEALEASEALLRELDACVIEGGPSDTDLGQFITDRLLLDREYQHRYVACVRAYDEANRALVEVLGEREDEPEVLVELRERAAWMREHGDSELFNPDLAEICQERETTLARLTALEAALGRDGPSLRPLSCPTEHPVQERPLTRIRAKVEGPSESWSTARTPEGRVVMWRPASDQTPAEIVSIAPGGEQTSVDLDRPHDAELLRWGPRGPIAVVDAEPVQLAVWNPDVPPGGAFELRPLPPDVGQPDELWPTPTRWYLASRGFDRSDPTKLMLLVSDDEGRSFRRLAPSLPELPVPLRFELWGHADDSGLLMLTIRKTLGPEESDETLREHPPTVQIGVVRVDADLDRQPALEVGALELEHDGLHGAGVNKLSITRPCVVEGGAMAVVAGTFVVRVDGVELELVHQFEPDQRPRLHTLTVACHGRELVMISRRAVEGEPPTLANGTESQGGPLVRHVCNAEGCDAGELVSDWASGAELRPTEAGVRGVVDIGIGPAAGVYVIDEPPGGPIERRELIGNPYSFGVIEWDGLRFSLNQRVRVEWGWF
ncbi:hypothetical protein G6O69_24730 [Pseudenhygromyxa sp. WMMC2535]|uniref:hypothetical protein n=1 Tax=Pseudenhygromyxa sp. WMMC2535 TaxID=2712867 RepID=UPI0015540F8B|nr:hypothetical protein [Pseudenhygromyxa sp. WMMC2535]NVB41068.1 hypothetical protein [Pseudenhygromyxa sp. WMMC2535]